MTASTAWQRLRFALIMRLAASALFARDALGLRFWPNHPDIRCHRAAAALSSPLCRRLLLPAGRRQIEAQLTLPVTPPDQPPRALVLLCHGIGERLNFWTQVQLQLADAAIGSLVFHYSSYGQSRGPATTEAFESDARTAYAFLASLSPNTPLFLFGTSLGSAVAAHVAAYVDPEPAGLILSQGFPSLRAATAAVFAQLGIRHPAPSRLVPDLWRSAEAIRSVRCPILVVHSPDDQLFPASMGESLYRAAAQRPSCRQTLLTPSGFAHNDVSLRPRSGYWSPIMDFILAKAAHSTKNKDAPTLGVIAKL
jgi:fermentation-respiration switch protein FrsA (DUF1100 family)